jgi:hypothetical protein
LKYQQGRDARGREIDIIKGKKGISKEGRLIGGQKIIITNNKNYNIRYPHYIL